MRRTTRALLVSTALCGVATVCSYGREVRAQNTNEGAAQIRFQRGRDLFAARNYEAALVEFRAAVALVSSPNTRLYIARCLHGLNRNADAVIEYQRAGAEAADRAASEPRYAATRDTARAESSLLEPLLGRLVIHVPNAPEGTNVTAGGTPVPSALFDVSTPSDPRAVEVVANAPGYLPFRAQATVATGATAEVTVVLQRDPAALRASASSAPPPAPVRERMVTVRQGGSVRYAGIGVAAVGLVAGGVMFGVFGSTATARYNELRTACPAGCPDRETTIAEGERAQLIADVAIGAGAALVVVGGIMAIVGGPHDVTMPAHDRARAARRPSWTVWGSTASTGGMAGIAGMF